MPVLTTEDGDFAAYQCDICGCMLQENDGGVMCPTCTRLFCSSCQVDYPMEEIKTRETGPRYKSKAVTCLICKKEWRRRHPKFKELKIDAFNI